MMGGQCSKKKDCTPPPPPPPPPPPQTFTSSEFNADLNLYVAACEADPGLRTFDAILQERTNRVINTLAAGGEVRALSLDSLREVTGCLLDTNQELVKIILEDKKDIWNNQDLFDLVEEYFDNSVKTLEFCHALENCLKRAQNSQLIIRVAVRQFEEDVESQDGFSEKKYVKTLDELQRFKAAGNPFTEEFFALFRSVYQQQESMLNKLKLRKKKFDKKLRSMKTWRRVSNVLFVAAFVSVLIFSVVAAAVAAPPVVTALAGALAVPIGSVGKWCNMLWNKYTKEVKDQTELVSSMRFQTQITIEDMKTIWRLVNKLEMKIESFVQNADIALTQEDAVSVKLVIDEIKKGLEVFMQTIEVLGAHAGMCSRAIIQARTVILQRIKQE